MTNTTISSVDDLPICAGCGLISHLEFGAELNELCGECFNRRERWLGGGPIRCVSPVDETYHETPRCPDFPDGQWWHWRDEECCYAELAGEIDRCKTCEYHYLRGGFQTGGDDE